MYLDVFWHFICCCKSRQTITIVGQQVSIHYNSSISRPGVHPKKAVGSPSYLACLEVGFSFPRGFWNKDSHQWRLFGRFCYRFFGWCVLCCFPWFFLPFVYSCITARWLLSICPIPKPRKKVGSTEFRETRSFYCNISLATGVLTSNTRGHVGCNFCAWLGAYDNQAEGLRRCYALYILWGPWSTLPRQLLLHWSGCTWGRIWPEFLVFPAKEGTTFIQREMFGLRICQLQLS